MRKYYFPVFYLVFVICVMMTICCTPKRMTDAGEEGSVDVFVPREIKDEDAPEAPETAKEPEIAKEPETAKEPEPVEEPIPDVKPDVDIQAIRDKGAAELKALLEEQARVADFVNDDSLPARRSPAGGRARKSAQRVMGGGGGGTSDVAYGIAIDSAVPPLNTVEFSKYDPNRFMSTAVSSLSTFGADVDSASYSIFRRMINEGRVPQPGMLWSEEMINYFTYDLGEPKSGEPFSVQTDITACPWNKDTKLLRVALATHKIPVSEQAPSNLVFLLDVSGSMFSDDKLPLLKKAVLLLVDQMKPQDRISLVTYASYQKVLLDGATYKERDKIIKAVESLEAGGFTAGEKGIQMAYALAEKNFISRGNNRILLGTDGDLNVGVTSETELKNLVEAKRKTGVFLSVLGFGFDNLKDNKMETLADNGNGSYHYIDTIGEARKVLVEEMSQTLFVAAKDVKFQVEFNPAKIKGYRQIGYETRKLAAEDFADDTKDGGEVGAGHQVTALYEIVEVGSAYPIAKVETKYQQVEVVDSNEWLTVSIRYKTPTGTESKLLSYPVDQSSVRERMPDDMIFASAVAQVGMILNKSVFTGSATIDSVLAQLSESRSILNDDYRKEFEALVRRLKTLE